MNQITTQYITENGACYEQYVITDPAAKTSLTIRVQPPPLRCAGALPQLRQPRRRRPQL